MRDGLLLLARLLLSALFFFSGFMKFMMAAQIAGMLGQMGLPVPLALAYLIGLSELVGGFALLVGFQTRIVSILLALWCVLTGVLVHHGEPIELLKNLGIAGGFLQLAMTTPGAFAFYGAWPQRRHVGSSIQASSNRPNAGHSPEGSLS